MKRDDDFTGWDLVIKPNISPFNLNLREVWSYRDLLILLVKRDFISFYKQTIFGPIWFFLQPAITTLVFTLIFGNIANIKTPNAVPTVLFYMSGVISWNYFSECFTKTATVFKDNQQILGKVYFPRIIMPISIVLSSLVKFAVQFLLLLFTYCYYLIYKGFKPDINIVFLLLPVLILMMASLGLGLGMIISAMTTKYRDLTFLIGFGVQLLMYGTTVIYPLETAKSSFPPLLYKLIEYNPMTSILQFIRYGFFGGTSPDIRIFFLALLNTFVILLLGVFTFNKVEKNFVDTI
jgi:lipopolysaccharide transport system permease protein